MVRYEMKNFFKKIDSSEEEVGDEQNSEWLVFFFQWHINLRESFNTKSILV